MPSPPWPEETGVWRTYDMHCHCGAIRWTMRVSPPFLEKEAEGKGVYAATHCLCSHCDKNGVVACHPKQSNVKFTQGLEDRMEYRFASKSIPHWFCKHCGSQIGADLTRMAEIFGGEPRFMINTRLLKGIPSEEIKSDVSTIMRNSGPKYEV